MIWQKQLKEFEDRKEWKNAIQLLENTIEKLPVEVEAYVSIIYLLHNLLLEEEIKNYELTESELENLLLKYYQDSYSMFRNNAEYLYFIGSIMHVAEWYFGQSDTVLALQMQKRATEIEPDNILFAFSYIFSISDKSKAWELAKKILLVEGDKLKWLKSKGFAGSYQIGTLKYCYDSNKNV